MKLGYTHIAVLLDSSGSMSSIKTDMIGGFNTFLKEQKEAPGEATLSLSQFSDKYTEIIKTTNIQNVEDLTGSTYIIGGMTALNDSLARVINDTGKDLAALDESERPERVLLVVITDGEENSSKEYDQAKVKALIEHQEKVYNWKVVYIGANVDVQVETKSRGISTSRGFAASRQGVNKMYEDFRSSTLSYRSIGNYDANQIAPELVKPADLSGIAALNGNITTTS